MCAVVFTVRHIQLIKKTLSVHVAKPETVALMVALEYRHLNYRIGEENLLVTLIIKIAQNMPSY